MMYKFNGENLIDSDNKIYNLTMAGIRLNEQQKEIVALRTILGKALFYMKNSHSYHAGDYNSTCVDRDCQGCALDLELVQKYGIKLNNINEKGQP